MKIFALIALAAGPAVAPAPEDFESQLARGELRLSPDQAVARAWEVAPEIEGARAAVTRAAAVVATARVGLVPRLDLRGRAQRVGGFPEGRIGVTPEQSIEITIPRNQFSWSAGVVYPLTRLFGEVLPELRSAQARLQAERHREEATRQALALSVREAYWLYAQARGTVIVAEASLEQLKDQAERLRVMTAAGLSTPADQAAGEARLEGATQSLVQAQGADVTTRATLGFLLALEGLPVVAIPRKAFALPGPEPRGLEALWKTAERTRPELLAFDGVTAALEQQRAALWSKRLPQVNLQADATYAQPNPNVIPPQEQFDPSWSVGGTLEWSPTDLWAAETQARVIDADLQKTDRERRTLVRSIRIQLRTQTAALETARQTWSASAARLTAANEAYRARLAAFENGRGIYTEVLEAEAELTSARLSKLQALVNARLARARLARAVGNRAGEAPRQ